MTRKPAFLWIFLLLAAAASLLCGLVSASQAGREYNDSDAELNAVYQKALAIITEPEDRRLLVEAQRSWLKFRDAEVAFHARYFPESKGGLFVKTGMTQVRTSELKGLMTPEAKEEYKPSEVPQ